jgi:hypothetical protein
VEKCFSSITHGSQYVGMYRDKLTNAGVTTNTMQFVSYLYITFMFSDCRPNHTARVFEKKNKFQRHVQVILVSLFTELTGKEKM